jgi:transcription elongation factor
MKIHPVGAELFQADGWRGGREANSQFSQSASASKISFGKPEWKDLVEDLRV